MTCDPTLHPPPVSTRRLLASHPLDDNRPHVPADRAGNRSGGSTTHHGCPLNRGPRRTRAPIRTKRDVRGITPLATDRAGLPCATYRWDRRLTTRVGIRSSLGDAALVGVMRTAAT